MRTSNEYSRDRVPAADMSTGVSELMTAQEVAAMLQVTSEWVYAQTRSKRIPHLRLGRYVRYRREALDAWMRQVELTSSSPPVVHSRRRAVVR